MVWIPRNSNRLIALQRHLSTGSLISKAQNKNNFSVNDFESFENDLDDLDDLIESPRDLLDLLVLPDHESSGGPRYPSRIGGEAVI